LLFYLYAFILVIPMLKVFNKLRKIGVITEPLPVTEQ
jgi:hypothetical protein